MEQIINLIDARQQGLKFFFTGIPCKHNHIAKRYTSNNTCIECDKKRCIQYKQKRNQHRVNKTNKTKEYKKQRSHQYYDVHKAEYKLYQIKNSVKIRQNQINRGNRYYLNHKVHMQTGVRNWYKLNPHKITEYTRLRNNKLKSAIPKWFEESLIKQIYLKRDELSIQWGIQLHVDHIIPINPKDNSVCGLHCWHNLQLLDNAINGQKSDRYQTDW